MFPLISFLKTTSFIRLSSSL